MGAHFHPTQAARTVCSGPSCRRTLGARKRFCPFHWRLLSLEVRAGLTDAYLGQQWHVFTRLASEAAALLRDQERERIAAAQADIARLIGERVD